MKSLHKYAIIKKVNLDGFLFQIYIITKYIFGIFSVNGQSL